MDSQAAENIAVVIGVVVAVSLALTQAVGPLVTYLVEAIKSTGKIRDGYSGLVAIIIGILLGMGLTGLADAMATEPYDLSSMLLLGALAGALMAAGSIKTYKAVGGLNTAASYSEGLAHGERLALTPTPMSYQSPEPQDFGQGYAAGYAAAQADHADTVPAEPHDAASWAATVDALGTTDQLTEAEQLAHDEAIKAAATEQPAAASPQNEAATG